MNIRTLAAPLSRHATSRAPIGAEGRVVVAPSSAVAGLAPIGRQRDFHPAIGGFDTEVWRLPACVGERDIALEVGVLPESLARQLGGLSGGWILGSDFFRDRAIVIAYPDGEVRDAPGGVALPRS